MAKGKRYEDAAKRFDRDHYHTPSESIDVIKSLAKANFDETVEVVFRLGVDPRKADQIVRGTVALPITSAPMTSWRRSRAACSTSTSPSPPRS